MHSRRQRCIEGGGRLPAVADLPHQQASKCGNIPTDRDFLVCRLAFLKLCRVSNKSEMPNFGLGVSMRNILTVVSFASLLLASSSFEAEAFCTDGDDGSAECRAAMCTLCANQWEADSCDEYRRMYLQEQGCDGVSRPQRQPTIAEPEAEQKPQQQPSNDISIEQRNDNTVNEIADLLYDSIDENEAEIKQHIHDKSKISKSTWRDIKSGLKAIKKDRAFVKQLMSKQSAKGRKKAKKLINVYDLSIVEDDCFIRSIKDVTYENVIRSCNLEIENYHDALRNLK
jgi:hypothetical protein